MLQVLLLFLDIVESILFICNLIGTVFSCRGAAKGDGKLLVTPFDHTVFQNGEPHRGMVKGYIAHASY